MNYKNHDEYLNCVDERIKRLLFQKLKNYYNGTVSDKKIRQAINEIDYLNYADQFADVLFSGDRWDLAFE